MGYVIDLLRQSGINNGTVNQLPKTLAQRPDFSDISGLRSNNLSAQRPAVPASQPQPMTGEQINNLTWTGNKSVGGNPTVSPVSSPVSNPAPSVDGLRGLLNSPLGRGLGGLSLGLGAAQSFSDIGTELGNLSNVVTGQADRNKAARRLLDNASKRYELALLDRQKANIPNSKGSAAKTGNGNYVPPFTGGQDREVTYQIIYTATYGYLHSNGTLTDVQTLTLQDGFTGQLQGLYWERKGDNLTVRKVVNGVEYGGFNVGDGTQEAIGISIQDIAITRRDGLIDTSGAPPNPNPPSDTYAPPLDEPKDRNGNPTSSPDFSPWLPTVSANKSNALQPKLTPNPANDNKPFKEPERPNYAPAITAPSRSSATPSPNSGVSKPETPTAQNSGNTLTRQPVTTTPIRPDISPSQSQDPLTKPLNPPKALVPPTTPNTPPSPDIGTIATVLGAIGLAISAIGQKTNKIDGQTTPQAQQTNAKQGVCDAMQPDQCGFEGAKQAATEATNPIKDVATANSGLLGNILAILNNLVTFLQGQLGKILRFLDNSIVDRAMGAANFAMNVHNALMLSNNLGKTLATVVDTALNFTGFKFYDATNGNATSASRAFSQNVSSIIVNLIGQDQYTELTNDWKVANRIYQSSTSLLNKTERLLGAQSKVAQKGNIDVANIGNALRANGIVNPNSYPPMAATKEANTPPDLMSDASSPLSSFAGQVRNLNTITKSVNSTLRNVSGIQKDFGKLADLTNSESKVRKSIRSQSANQAKIKAKFTFLQIKQIKVTGKK